MNSPNKTDTGQKQKPEGHQDNKPTGFPVCGLSYYLEKKLIFLSWFALPKEPSVTCYSVIF